jgi:hypothetical protein
MLCLTILSLYNAALDFTLQSLQIRLPYNIEENNCAIISRINKFSAVRVILLSRNHQAVSTSWQWSSEKQNQKTRQNGGF